MHPETIARPDPVTRGHSPPHAASPAYGCAEAECGMPAAGAGFLVCRRCARSLRPIDGIMVDSALPPAADAIPVDAEALRQVSAVSSARLGDHWWSMLRQEFGERSDLDLLEVGAGPGVLTLGLATRGRARRLVVSDASRSLLAANRLLLLEAGVEPGPHLTWLAGSIGDLPLRSESLDAVLGNSVLRQVRDYTAVLAVLARLLRPGGVLILGEPVLQGRAFIGLLARLLHDLDIRTAAPLFSTDEHRLLFDLATMSRSEFWRGEGASGPTGDQHLFDVEEIRRLAPALGYADLEVRPWKLIEDGFLAEFREALRGMGINDAPLAAYTFLFEAVQDQLVAQLGAAVPTAFAHLVFRR